MSQFLWKPPEIGLQIFSVCGRFRRTKSRMKGSSSSVPSALHGKGFSCHPFHRGSKMSGMCILRSRVSIFQAHSDCLFTFLPAAIKPESSRRKRKHNGRKRRTWKRKNPFGGGSAPDSLGLGPPILYRRPEAKLTPLTPLPPLTPFYSDHPLGHAAQNGWDCLLHAFRACIRLRVPTLEQFISDCTSMGFVGVSNNRRVGFSIQMLRMWLHRHMPLYALKLMKGLFQVCFV